MLFMMRVWVKYIGIVSLGRSVSRPMGARGVMYNYDLPPPPIFQAGRSNVQCAMSMEKCAGVVLVMVALAGVEFALACSFFATHDPLVWDRARPCIATHLLPTVAPRQRKAPDTSVTAGMLGEPV